jgi:hypothetical protein
LVDRKAKLCRDLGNALVVPADQHYRCCIEGRCDQRLFLMQSNCVWTVSLRSDPSGVTVRNGRLLGLSSVGGVANIAPGTASPGRGAAGGAGLNKRTSPPARCQPLVVSSFLSGTPASVTPEMLDWMSGRSA